MSSEGADFYHVNYDIVAATKAMLEVLCKYMNQRLLARECAAHAFHQNRIHTRCVWR